MNDTEPRTAAGKVLWMFSMSLDGFVAGPNHEMGWMTGFTGRPGLIEEYIKSTGADGARTIPDGTPSRGWLSRKRKLAQLSVRPPPPPPGHKPAGGRGGGGAGGGGLCSSWSVRSTCTPLPVPAVNTPACAAMTRAHKATMLTVKTASTPPKPVSSVTSPSPREMSPPTLRKRLQESGPAILRLPTM